MRNLTYLDLSGHPRIRRFVVSAVVILGFLAVLWWFLGRPQPQSGSLLIPADADTRTGSRSGFVPAIQPEATPIPTSMLCPEDPAAWMFVEIFPGDNLKRIEPTCVYEGLAHTAAWMLLERMGYSKPEAADLLELERLPWSPVERATAYSNYQGPMEIRLLLEWPAHPDFFFWQLDRNGQPANVISLRGCFRIGEQVMCMVALDRSPGSSVSVLGEHSVTSHAADRPGTRTFHLLSYAGNGLWQLNGQLADQTVAIENQEEVQVDRDQISARLGAVPWDAAWLASHYGLSMKKAPEGWRIFDMDPSSMQAIAETLNRFASAPAGDGDE